jgi:hypothetical protein
VAWHGVEPDADLRSEARGQVVLHRCPARLNDSRRANGVFELWINGGLEARFDELNWQGASSEYGINAVFLENYWNDGAPQSQECYFDNFVVSTQLIGCSDGRDVADMGIRLGAVSRFLVSYSRCHE